MTDQKQQDRARSRHDKEMNDVRVVLSSREGRRFIWRHLDLLFADPQCDTDSDTFIKIGRQREQRRLLNAVATASPKAWRLMQEEAEVEAAKEIKPEKKEEGEEEDV